MELLLCPQPLYKYSVLLEMLVRHGLHFSYTVGGPRQAAYGSATQPSIPLHLINIRNQNSVTMCTLRHVSFHFEITIILSLLFNNTILIPLMFMERLVEPGHLDMCYSVFKFCLFIHLFI